ncbi:MAG: carboxynorspermidine decarboxylase [Bacteroidetes bacterium GWF2_43_63]|nr:MAG: carboxynorspermidine decarboxylase [Bacteroidetes bacterium GWE2_42_42]OFY54823.1 MAG: carboxynorspermidine decarboxylase [Bacteroidetes bacterium GWF2_43_63]HCB63277.1 carboxynorspermidine decarboxylase [Bacteroidales bacterium]HCY22019.1 carboxynorspermidine decarboxylase [Bacteroidales bacterium]
MHSNIPSPCFVLEESKLLANLQLMQKVRNEAGIDILVALKGMSFWHYFPLMKQYLSGACASSVNEARLIFEEMGVKSHTYAPAYEENDFEQLLQLSQTITFNSLNQWKKYKSKMLQHPEIHAGLRINPGYSEIETDIYNPAVPGSRLGIPLEQLPAELPEGISGLHFHVMCEQDSYVLERVLKVVEEKFGHLLKQAQWLNMGGGHHITRADYQPEHLIALLKDFKSRYPNLQIILEPGEAVGWRTGFLLATVLDVVESGGIKTAILDVSFSAHMPDTLEMPYKPIISGAGESDEFPFKYRMGGSTCLAGDFYGDYSFPYELKPGDRIEFEDMIHYTMVKTTLFNGVRHPHIGKIDREEKFTLLRSVGYEEYKNRLS